jgi:hypothetical protein
MKDDGYAGGQGFVLPTDMHFTLLCFTSALGDPVLCAGYPDVVKRDTRHSIKL